MNHNNPTFIKMCNGKNALCAKVSFTSRVTWLYQIIILILFHNSIELTSEKILYKDIIFTIFSIWAYLCCNNVTFGDFVHVGSFVKLIFAIVKFSLLIGDGDSSENITPVHNTQYTVIIYMKSPWCTLYNMSYLENHCSPPGL